MDDMDRSFFGDLPAVLPPGGAQVGGRQDAGELYRRTVVAKVQVTDLVELRDAALRHYDDAGYADEDVIDDDLGTGARDEIAASDATALSWIIEPTAGLWDVIDVGAMKVMDSSVEVDQSRPDYFLATWEVTIRLLDEKRLRQRAVAASPASADSQHSLAAEWNAAAPPDLPLREIDGITWTLESVTVEHVPTGTDQPAKT